MRTHPTWGIHDYRHGAEYWLNKRRVPEWLFYLILAIWPPLRRSVVSVRRMKFSPNAIPIVGFNLRNER